MVRHYATAYSELLARPAILVESTAGSFSYRNVPLRIVALRSNTTRLEAILAKLGAATGYPRYPLAGSLINRGQRHSRTSTKCPAIAAAAAIAGDTRWVRPL